MGKAGLLILLILCAFNRIDYNSIEMGSSAPKMVERFGEPYAVYDQGDGKLVYEYIERVAMNGELMYETHYFISVDNEQIVDKNFRETYRPGYDSIWQSDPNYPTYP